MSDNFSVSRDAMFASTLNHLSGYAFGDDSQKKKCLHQQ